MSEFFWLWLYVTMLNLEWLAPVSIFILIILFIAGALFRIEKAENIEDPKQVERAKEFVSAGKEIHGFAKIFAVFTLVVCLIFAAIPSKADLAWIIGGGAVWKIGQNEEVQKLPENLARMANKFMESAKDSQEESDGS